jgi:hypothetical protein
MGSDSASLAKRRIKWAVGWMSSPRSPFIESLPLLFKIALKSRSEGFGDKFVLCRTKSDNRRMIVRSSRRIFCEPPNPRTTGCSPLRLWRSRVKLVGYVNSDWNVNRSSPVTHQSLATSRHSLPCDLYWGLTPSTERSVKLQKAWLRMTSLSPSLGRFFQLRRFPDIGSRSGGKKPNAILQLQCLNSPLAPPPNRKPKNGLASSPLPFPHLPFRLQVLANCIPDERKARNVHHHVTVDTVQ